MLPKMLITLGTTLAFATAVPSVQAQTSPVTVATIQATLQGYPKQIRSMSCKVTTTTTTSDAFFQANNIPADDLPRFQVEQGEWAFKGDKVINKSKYLEGDSAPAGHNTATVNLFNGSTNYRAKSENGTPTIRDTYGSREHRTRADGYWSPLVFGYQLDRQWLSDFLSSGNPVLERVGNDPTYGRLYVIHLSSPGKEEHIWFAPKYGNIAVKIVQDTLHERAVYTGARYERKANLWLPLQGEFQSFTKQLNGKTDIQIDKKFAFSNVQVNTVPDKAFDYHWPTGMALYDNDTRTKYFRDASGNWVKRTDIAGETAHAPSRVSAAVAPWVLLLCLAALLTLGYLRWRRRASA